MNQGQREKKPTEQWKEAFRKSIIKFLLRGDYRGGLVIARQGLKLYPNEFECRLQYAKLLGDWADELPAKRQAKLKREAVKILKPLTRALSGKTPKQRFSVCLNYYYQLKDYKGMAAFGRRLSLRRDRNGLYAQALGACLYAHQLHGEKKGAQAKQWAAKSVRAWGKYDLAKEDYYFAHYSLAKALALNEEPKLALARLKIAARLSRRKITDWEFADVLILVNGSKRD